MSIVLLMQFDAVIDAKLHHMNRRRVPIPAKRRTTLTLPTDSLRQVEALAMQKGVTASAIVAGMISDGLSAQAAAKRGRDVVEAYRRAFDGFTEEERLLLDGIVLDPLPPRKRK
ncbi:MAG: hypothetical protein SFV18_14580 [Bryobacteraceae bacterium]|nr:hypothetical protein [Bryobacteraceae bacterium]